MYDRYYRVTADDRPSGRCSTLASTRSPSTRLFGGTMRRLYGRRAETGTTGAACPSTPSCWWPAGATMKPITCAARSTATPARAFVASYRCHAHINASDPAPPCPSFFPPTKTCTFRSPELRGTRTMQSRATRSLIKPQSITRRLDYGDFPTRRIESPRTMLDQLLKRDLELA